MLVNDVDFTGIQLNPIGNEEVPFCGNFDGNYHKISNLTLNEHKYLGLFGKISYQGEVKNITIENSKYVIDNTDDNERGYNDRIYAGSISGINEGNIINCHIKGIEIEISQETFELVNDTIVFYCGGITGLCSAPGQILYCSVEDTMLDVSSERDFSYNSEYGNANTVYCGGIVALLTENTKLESCYVDKQTIIRCYAKSYYENNFSSGSPYVTTRAGGIAAVTRNIDSVKEIYSEASIEKCLSERKNNAWSGLSTTENCTSKSDIYIVDVSFEDKKRIIAASKENIIFPKKEGEHQFAYTFSCKYDKENNCYEDQIYECDAKTLKLNNMHVTVDGKKVGYEVLSYCGLGKNPSDEVNMRTNLNLIIIAIGEEKSYFCELSIPIIVKQNEPASLDIECYPTNLVYNKGEEITLGGGRFVLTYKNGIKEDVSDCVSFTYDSAKYGKSSVTVCYGELKTSYIITIKCSHEYVKEITPATCSIEGYTTYTCQNCGDSYTIDYTATIPHNKGIKKSEFESCDSRYIGDECYCIDCGHTIKMDINKTKHEFIEDEHHNDSHICKHCGYSEGHQFVIAANNGKIIYTCLTCGYVDEEEGIVSTDMPRIIVSDTYSLEGGDSEVEVYVQILNNPGITGATFSINYGGLEYIRHEMGNVLYNDNSDVNITATACFVIMGNAAADDNSGNLIKLVLKVPLGAKEGDSYDIVISHCLRPDETSFTDENVKPIRILTIPGKVTVVRRLPGDVNNDGIVDILDTVLLKKYLNRKIADGDLEFDKKYADVNLDNVTDIVDFTTLLQYISGGYGAKLVSNRYKIVLDAADDQTILEPLEVQFYREDGTIGEYGDLGTLPILKRDGYRFDGWYTGLFDGVEVSGNREIWYNPNQYRQTLYARYTRNIVYFDGNGETFGEMMPIMYEVIEIEGVEIEKKEANLTNRYTKECKIIFNDFNMDRRKKTIETYFEFDEWVDGNNAYKQNETIELKFSAIGECRLIAKWKTIKVDLLTPEERKGYIFIGWAYDENGKEMIGNEITYIQTNETILNLYAIWEPIQYKIKYDGNNSTSGEMPSLSDSPIYTISSQFVLPENMFFKQGYKFIGWGFSENSDTVKYCDEKTVDVDIFDNIVEGTVTLFAVWSANIYRIEYFSDGSHMGFENVTYGQIIKLSTTVTKEGHSFDGWYTKTNELITAGFIMCFAENMILEAKWKPNNYVISCNANGGKLHSSGQTVYVTYGRKIGYLPLVLRDGYNFLHWETASGNYEKMDGDTIYMHTQDIEIIAKWELVCQGNYTLRKDNWCTKRVDHEDSIVETIIPDGNFNVDALKAANYKNIKVTVVIYASEIENGTQQFWAYNKNGKEFWHETFQNNGKGDKTWQKHTFDTTISIDELTSSGGFSIKYGAYGVGSGNDEWLLGETRITVEAC